MTLGYLAPDGSPAGSLIITSVMAPLLLTGMQCGAIKFTCINAWLQ